MTPLNEFLRRLDAKEFPPEQYEAHIHPGELELLFGDKIPTSVYGYKIVPDRNTDINVIVYYPLNGDTHHTTQFNPSEIFKRMDEMQSEINELRAMIEAMQAGE